MPLTYDEKEGWILISPTVEEIAHIEELKDITQFITQQGTHWVLLNHSEKMFTA